MAQKSLACDRVQRNNKSSPLNILALSQWFLESLHVCGNLRMAKAAHRKASTQYFFMWYMQHGKKQVGYAFSAVLLSPVQYKGALSFLSDKSARKDQVLPHLLCPQNGKKGHCKYLHRSDWHCQQKPSSFGYIQCMHTNNRTYTGAGN